MIDIKFIPTGNIFSLPDEEANRISIRHFLKYGVLFLSLSELKL